jgi:hypothetical protein
VWLASRPGRLYPRERPGAHCTGGWVGPGAGLDRCGKSRPTWIRSPDLPARSKSLYRLSYRGSLITPVHNKILLNCPFLSPAFLQMSTQKYVNGFFGLNKKYHCPCLYNQLRNYLQLGNTLFCLRTKASGHLQLSLLVRFVKIKTEIIHKAKISNNLSVNFKLPSLKLPLSHPSAFTIPNT